MTFIEYILEHQAPEWVRSLKKQPKQLGEIMTKLSELSAQLATVKSQLSKATTEIVAKVQELQDALINVALSPEAEAALAELATQAQALDDIVPDVPVTSSDVVDVQV